MDVNDFIDVEMPKDSRVAAFGHEIHTAKERTVYG
jgi:hypothetical protein